MRKRGGLHQRYVRAILQLDLEGLTLGQLKGQLLDFVGSLQASKDLRNVFENPAFTRGDRKAIAGEVLSRLGAGGACRRTLSLLIDKDRLVLLPEIVQELDRHLDERAGVLRAEVAAPAALTPEQERKLTEALSALRKSPVKVSVRVDPAVIGGLVIELDGVVYDGSVRRRLADLRDRILGAAE